MTDNHPPPRLLDAGSIAAAGHRHDTTVIMAALVDPDPEVRRLALGAALRVGRLDVEQLRAGLGDPEAEVRLRSIALVCRHPDGHELLTDVIGFLDGTGPEAELAAFVIGELEIADPTAVAALEHQALHHHDALARESAVAALGALHAGLDTILAALGDKATVRRRAVIALAPFDGPEVDAALTRALDDRDWQVRQAAEDLLR